jgi:hypothetical protein
MLPSSQSAAGIQQGNNDQKKTGFRPGRSTKSPTGSAMMAAFIRVSRPSLEMSYRLGEGSCVVLHPCSLPGRKPPQAYTRTLRCQ